MSARKTSAVVYEQIEREGLLSKRRWEAYRTLYQHGPMTSGEACAVLGQAQVPSQIRARFFELREWGVIEELGERECRVTGRIVIEWDVTDRLPQEPAPSLEETLSELYARAAKLEEKLEKVRAEIAALEERRLPPPPTLAWL